MIKEMKHRNPMTKYWKFNPNSSKKKILKKFKPNTHLTHNHVITTQETNLSALSLKNLSKWM